MLCLQVNQRKSSEDEVPNENFSGQLIFKIGDTKKEEIDQKEGRILFIDSNIEIFERKCSLTYISDKILAVKSINDVGDSFDESSVVDLEEKGSQKK